jgi:hypothetical protein
VGDSSLLLGIDRWQFSQKSWSRERDVEVMSRKRFHLVYEGEKDNMHIILKDGIKAKRRDETGMFADQARDTYCVRL